VGPLTLQQVRDAWPEILERVEKSKRSSWMVVFASQARALKDDVLTVAFQSETDAARFKEQQQGAGESVSEHLRRAILDVLGIRVKFIARVESGGPVEDLAPPPEPEYDEAGDPYDRGPVEAPPVSAPPAERPSQPAARPQQAPEPARRSPAPEPARSQPAAEPARTQPATGGWSVVQIPQSEPASDDPAPSGATRVEEPRRPAAPAAEPVEAPRPVSEPAERPTGAATPPPRQAPQRPPAAAERPAPESPRRYGESVVREILNASFIEEQKIAPPPQRPEF
jgi:DNA polymerase-3 subunit gamma/tau